MKIRVCLGNNPYSTEDWKIVDIDDEDLEMARLQGREDEFIVERVERIVLTMIPFSWAEVEDS